MIINKESILDCCWRKEAVCISYFGLWEIIELQVLKKEECVISLENSIVTNSIHLYCNKGKLQEVQKGAKYENKGQQQ